MADADKKMREPIDERVYPGAPSQGAGGGAETSDGAPGASRSQIIARAVLAVSLVLVIGSGAYFALRPSPAPEVQQAGSAVVAADVDDADDARADDEMGSSDADPDRGDGAKASASTGGGADKADGSSGGSAVPAEGARGSPLHIPAHRVLPALPMVRPPANRGLPAGRDRAHRVSRLHLRRPRLRSV